MRRALIRKICELAPSADFADPTWGELAMSDFVIEFDMGHDEIADSIMRHVRESVPVESRGHRTAILGGVGIDIQGFVECRPWAGQPEETEEVSWEAAARLDCLNISRDYDAFGCLFGVMNFAGIRPIAADRGLPEDASPEVRREHQDLYQAAQGTTWVSWQEILSVDWSEPADHVDARLHEYRRDEGGQWRFAQKAAWSRAAFEAQDLPVPPPGTPPLLWPEGSTWTSGDRQFRAERLTRRDAVPAGGAWQPVWDVMTVLGSLHGVDNCRLVVWFEG